MSRSRLLLFAGAVGVLLLGGALSLVRVPAGEIVLAGERALGAGTHVTAPWTPRVRIPVSAELVLDPVPAVAPDGTDVPATVRAQVDADPADLRVRAPAVAGAGGWSPYLAGLAAEELSATLRRWPDADPLSGEPRLAAEAAMARAMERAGVRAESVRLVDGDAQAWRSYREARILGLARPASRKVLVLGLDGADWQVLDPLLRAGRVPALASLIRNGVRADLRSNEPMLSPLLWTTVATGKAPEEHGIVDFLLVEPGTGRRVPMSSSFRRSKALWNILTDMGRESAFVAWWATWPAERMEGTLVTDRVSYSLFAGITPATDGGSAGLTFPPGYIREIGDRLVRPGEIEYGEARRFLRIDRAEFERGRSRLDEPPAAPPEDPVVALARVLASARTYHAIALDLLARGQPELMAVYYEGIDQVGHRFMHYGPPKMAMVSDAEHVRYRDTVTAYYEYQDRLVGEVVERADPGTVFLVLSDHGFKSGAGRPRDLAPYVSERPGFWHRRYGIFVLAGPGVRRGAIDTVTLYDIAPTILHLLGLPLAEDMPGRVLEEALEGSVGEPVRVATYEGIGEPSQAPISSAAGSAIEEEMVRELTALGYLSPEAASGGPGGTAEGGEAEVTANYHLNLASILAGQGKYDEAEAEVRAGLAKAEIPDGYRVLSEILEKQGRLDEAIEALEMSLDAAQRLEAAGAQGAKGPGDAGRLRLVGLMLDAGRVEDARRLSEGKFASASMARTARGLLAERDGRTAEAVRLYRAALEEDPTQGAAMIRLYPLTPPERMHELEPIVRRGLRENDQLAPYHNVLGVILKGRGDLSGAVTEYRRALEQDPDNVDYLTNLGNAEMIRGRLDVSVEVLERARRKEPDNADVWMGLGSVHGKAGRAQESLQAFERARELGATGPGLAVGIALAHVQLGDPDQARRVISEARSAYPTDPTLAELESMLQ